MPVLHEDSRFIGPKRLLHEGATEDYYLILDCKVIKLKRNSQIFFQIILSYGEILVVCRILGFGGVKIVL